MIFQHACKKYNIPPEIFQEALRKEFVDYEVTFQANTTSHPGDTVPNGVGILRAEGEGVNDRIENVFMGLIEKYNTPSVLAQYKFLFPITE
ncbi:MAG: hypothetical protein WAW61_06950 [Methylococcaceae bacterium]